MTMHMVEYSYNLPEWGSIELDLDDDLDKPAKEAQAIAAIKEIFDDIADVEITKMTDLSA